MPERPSGWRLALLGPPRLMTPNGAVVPCERKTAGLLSYLALEGPTPRARLAALLWPDTPMAVARNNLLHLLRRLRDACGEDLTGGGDPLRLMDGVQVDANALNAPPGARDLPDGTLLDGVDLDACPDLAEWLFAQRELIATRRVTAYHASLRWRADRGDLSEALILAERLLRLDPLDEELHRTLMRLHYLNGDRPAALRAYHRCKDLLARELCADPAPDTVQLARSIDEGTLSVHAPEPSTKRLPLSVLRPPTLIGREAAWAQLEAAWAAGKMIYITGDPGVGKTRFAQDFARSKGRTLYLPGHPGMEAVPFSGAAHNARARLAAAPQVQLPDDVRRQLSRVLPELRDGQDPPPMVGDADRLQFFGAHMDMVRRTSAGFAAVIADDTQYYDQATVDLGTYMLSRAPLGARDGIPRHLSVYRRGELTPEVLATVDHLVQTGVAVRIELGPLDERAMSALLRDLDVPDIPEVHRALLDLTGGNPQFVLETVKHLHERGDFGAAPTLRGAPATVTAMIGRRLARLSPLALQVARAAAVLRSDFSIELVTEVLGATLLDTAGAWEELEDAQVMTGEHFAHDLVLEAALAGLPDTTHRLLHRGSARVLARTGAEAARVARHWLSGGDLKQAAPWLLRAGEAAEGTLRLPEALQLYEDARRAYANTDDASGMKAASRAIAQVQARLSGA
ncbi:ATP-binding protein [Deinococcus hopiensis]|uniref:AAA ATPase domain-containing protein n=1 Tax=Deinococcus hopiensis KR-140 TaxID=695939 RepID=A0A1W1UB07_9DEIO|nr:BTAD domain-containing putative transcriptional regulator [Deinococcus hopiensis]SMB78243.1 AAA ATPase domain-containing protein [Deinococcus hopiensis KR-140]